MDVHFLSFQTLGQRNGLIMVHTICIDVNRFATEQIVTRFPEQYCRSLNKNSSIPQTMDFTFLHLNSLRMGFDITVICVIETLTTWYPLPGTIPRQWHNYSLFMTIIALTPTFSSCSPDQLHIFSRYSIFRHSILSRETTAIVSKITILAIHHSSINHIILGLLLP